MSTTLTAQQLPQTVFERVVVERPFKGSDKFGNIRVQLPQPVVFERNDGGEPTSTNPRWDITVSADRHPEVFNALKNAPLGVHLRITAQTMGRGARVRRGQNEYTNYLGAYEALAVENLGFPEASNDSDGID